MKDTKQQSKRQSEKKANNHKNDNNSNMYLRKYISTRNTKLKPKKEIKSFSLVSKNGKRKEKIIKTTKVKKKTNNWKF